MPLIVSLPLTAGSQYGNEKWAQQVVIYRIQYCMVFWGAHFDREIRYVIYESLLPKLHAEYQETHNDYGLIVKEKVPKAKEAQISLTSPTATEMLELCNKGMILSDEEEPDVLGKPEYPALDEKPDVLVKPEYPTLVATKPRLLSSGYQELVEKYCFYGSAVSRLSGVEPWIHLFNASSEYILAIISFQPGKALTGGGLSGSPTGGGVNVTTTLYEQHAGHQELRSNTQAQVQVSFRNKYVYVDVYRSMDAQRPFMGRRVPLGGVLKYEGGLKLRVFDRKGREICPPQPPRV